MRLQTAAGQMEQRNNARLFSAIVFCNWFIVVSLIFWQAAARAVSLCCVSDVTRVIEAIQQGDPKAADELLPLVYEELRKLAAVRMSNEAAGQTLQPTALVHEAWLRLVGSTQPQEWNGRGHFFGAAAEAMRRI